MREQYEGDPSVVYSIDRNDRIVWCNKAWDEFAASNGAPELLREKQNGRSVFDVIPAALEPFYKNLFRLVTLYGREAGHVYECSTPELQRWYYMRVLPDATGLLVVNSLVRASPHVADRYTAGVEYRSKAGVISMCGHCRRTYHPNHERWDWVPRFVQLLPEGTRNGLCDFCRAYYYVSWHGSPIFQV